jgi:PhzF family phenazine biosynthesis protein
MLARERPTQTEFRFHTRSGELVVTRDGDVFTLDFPAREVHSVSLQPAVDAALGSAVLALSVAAGTFIAEVEDESTVQNLQPDFRAILALDCRGLIVTARGTSCDIVSRFFAPKIGIDEDPVTGSAHCALVPYWAPRLGKTRLAARQLSARGGDLQCELRGDRVLMSGHAVLYSTATLHVPQTLRLL